MTKQVTVNEIDGSAVQTLEDGPMEEVIGRVNDRIRELIAEADADPKGVSQSSWEEDGEEHTVRVIVRPGIDD
jgi:hypothetical protein